MSVYGTLIQVLHDNNEIFAVMDTVWAPSSLQSQLWVLVC